VSYTRPQKVTVPGLWFTIVSAIVTSAIIIVVGANLLNEVRAALVSPPARSR
jgi:ABC-type thiamin/hydroxymethylpyrimidine transport system permease subunit